MDCVFFALLKCENVALAANFPHQNVPFLGKLESCFHQATYSWLSTSENGTWAPKWPLDPELNFFQAL